MSVNGGADVSAAMRAWLVDHDEAVKQATLRAAVDCEREAKMRTPVDFGRLRSSITYRFSDDGYAADVYTDVSYAAYVEYGTRPHMPPLSALVGWAARHGFDASFTPGIGPRDQSGYHKGDTYSSAVWALAMHIKKYGTKEHPYMRPAWEAVKPRYYKDLVEALR